MEGHCSTGQSPQRAVVPMEEEEEEEEEEESLSAVFRHRPPRTVGVGILVAKFALGQVFARILPVTVIT